MKKKKTQTDILIQTFLNTADICLLLQVPRPTGKKIYDACNKIDDAEMGLGRIEPRKVRFKTVMKVTGTDVGLLRKQIKA